MKALSTAKSDKRLSCIPGTTGRKPCCATSTPASRNGFFGTTFKKRGNGIGTSVNVSSYGEVDRRALLVLTTRPIFSETNTTSADAVLADNQRPQSRPAAKFSQRVESYSTYPPTTQSELFYTALEKRQAQCHKCRARFSVSHLTPGQITRPRVCVRTNRKGPSLCPDMARVFFVRAKKPQPFWGSLKGAAIKQRNPDVAIGASLAEAGVVRHPVPRHIAKVCF